MQPPSEDSPFTSSVVWLITSATQQAQLNSLIFLITEQLDGVVNRCQDGWMNGEVKP